MNCIGKVSLTGLVLTAILLVHASSAGAETFPSKPVRLLVPTEPGGSVDYVARLLGQKLSAKWSQPVLVENKAGAGGVIGAAQLATSPPDGYTLGLMTTSFTSAASVGRKLPYDPVRDFIPVAVVGDAKFVMVVSTNMPAKSLADLIKLAKQKPGQINYGSLGVGSGVHLATEVFCSMAGIKMTHVAYKGSAGVVNAIAGGQVDFGIVGVNTALPMSRAGKVRIIGVTSARRSPELPDVPAAAEVVPNYKFDNWFGVLAPKNTPTDVVAKIKADLAEILVTKDVREGMAGQGLEAAAPGSEELARTIRAELAEFSAIAKKMDLRLD